MESRIIFNESMENLQEENHRMGAAVKISEETRDKGKLIEEAATVYERI